MSYNSYNFDRWDSTIQLWNHHGKFLTGGDNEPHGHHDPNHGYNNSSYWVLEQHTDGKVRLRNHSNGKYLSYEGGQHLGMHHDKHHHGTHFFLWSVPGWGHHDILLQTHNGHYVHLDGGDHHVHAKNHVNEGAKFTIRYV